MIYFLIFLVVVFVLTYRAKSLEYQGEMLYAGCAWGVLAFWWHILVGGPGPEGWSPTPLLIIALGVASLIACKAVYEEYKQWHDDSLKTIRLLTIALPIVFMIKVWEMSEFVQASN